ncbi:hypothetical protein IWQ62_000399 [Dispira parvispora]|uniref:DNA repair protein RAD51 homolog 3 n=1 Tax=Dispira parvispora TaxID=1520584 RepID=A0A9W8AUV0_9FUNG|nr:hypothetical protein IWQ62_000399 [Dispira parvispora]
MSRPIASLNLSPRLSDRLLHMGYRCVEDLKDISTLELAQDVGISLADAQLIMQHIQPADHPIVSASQLFQKEQQRIAIPTGSKALDQIFGSMGLEPGRLYELLGVPGVGKTQLGMQLCVNVQTPQHLGGAGGQAIFIDTEGTFVAERAQQMAQSAIQRWEQTALAQLPHSGITPTPLPTVEDILEGILYLRVLDVAELDTLVKQLRTFCEVHPGYKLVVLDSIAFPIRASFLDKTQRIRLLHTLGYELHALAREHELVVVITNQMTTRFPTLSSPAAQTSGTKSVSPALGDTWSDICQYRVVFYWDGDTRYARVLKSPFLQELSAPFSIEVTGIEDSNV